MVAELVADLTVDDAKDIRARVDEKADRQGIRKGSQDYQNLVRAEVQTTMNWSKLGAAVAVALAGHDVDVGVDVATNALENNFFPLVAVGVAAVEALASAGGATLAASAGVLTALGLNELATSFQENDDSSIVATDAHPEEARWEDESITTEEARSRPLITPTPERMPTLGGYEGASSDVRTRDEGYTAHHGPNTSILTSEKQKEFSLSKEAIAKVYKHDCFGKFYKNKEDGYYYTKDQAKHGGSTWKVYKETGRGLEWRYDLDQFGEKMDKHKGDTGKFIPKKDLNGVNGK
ncbi:VENN motif pre-toxin domain-containing protein [Candidatus Paracaedibacter symbiosus]|uniref:VENN motif pre-toxin domain-containing protein n=1 Tax=Candidatus Paracaedibacter symbiosus TaxID=244582 RepID=UPI0005096CFE|nr:VENN motif pre-toxin domain-containing protein [Candidatus Paracaedibacter symbiosus]